MAHRDHQPVRNENSPHVLKLTNRDRAIRNDYGLYDLIFDDLLGVIFSDVVKDNRNDNMS